MSEHLSGYQARDREVVDYALFELEGTGLTFRGPAPASLEPGGFVACLGAAQTFGCFVERPFPTLLSEALGLPVLNLGYGGAGARFFLRQEPLLELLDRAALVVVQAMSGRSEDNALFESGGLEYLTVRADGRRLGAREAWDEVVSGRGRLAGWPLPRRLRRGIERRLARPATARLVHETRAAWTASTCALLDRLRAPKAFLWFSKRTPAYVSDPASVHRLFGEFPQLVDEAMVASARAHADAYVEVVSERGSPQPLVSRFTGAPCEVRLADDRPDFGTETWSENRYYPSPEMHADVLAALAPVVRELLAGRHEPQGLE